MDGRFISVEGVEGAGKSTNIALLVERLQSAGLQVVRTREPGGTPFAEAVRELLLAPRSEPVDATAELLLMFAARAQHLNSLIKPALAQGKWVVCDRFTDATYAYQGGGRELGFAAVAVLEKLVQGEFRPHHTLFLDVPTRQGMARVASRGTPDRFEQEREAFFERVRNSYLQLIAADPDRFILIDASQSLDLVQRDLNLAIDQLLAQVKL